MKCSLVRCCRKSVRKPEAFRTLFCTFFGEVNILGTEDTECVPVTDYMYVRKEFHMKIVVVKSPKLLSSLFRMIFRIQKETPAEEQ